MKHLLILFLALGSFLTAAETTSPKNKPKPSFWDSVSSHFEADKIVLDTKLITADKKVSSLYTKQEGVANRGEARSQPSRENSITFYVDVNKLLGGKKLKKDTKYRLDSISWICHPDGYFSGGSRHVTISNGTEAFIRPLPETKKGKLTIHQMEEESNFTFERGDILEVTITWRADTVGQCSITYFDAPPAPAAISGTALNLNLEGELPDGTASDNRFNRSWRFNCPAVRIRATEVQAINYKMAGIIALGILGLILIIKLMVGSQKD
ncbi:MAG: hypothetical protein IJ985_02635 [Akkermansia sp.]|nr:hypothetical protein [Akkermansia sp.]